jgi:archaeal flagellar protein FlaI
MVNPVSNSKTSENNKSNNKKHLFGTPKKAPPPKLYRVISDAGQKIIQINYNSHAIVPSIEDSAFCMSQLINFLMEVGDVTQVVFTQREDFIYDGVQAHMLSELARFTKQLLNEKDVLNKSKISDCQHCFHNRYNFMRIFVMSELREDPIGAYLHLVDKFEQEKKSNFKCANCNSTNSKFVKILEQILILMSKLELIKQAKPYFKEYDPKTREVYSKIFHPQIKPSYLFAKVTKLFPIGALEINNYSIEDSKIVIFRKKDEIRPIYHIVPPEYNLFEEQYTVLGHAKEVLSSHQPKRSEFISPEHTRGIFMKVGKDLLADLSKAHGLKIDYNEIDKLSNILVRYTIGFGILEVLLKDPNIQDISVNSPASATPITIVHSEYGECVTNVTITPRDIQSWATKLRLMSGRPLDEANPVLDTELILPGIRARVAAIQRPLSPTGIAFSFRRHRSKPWTLPLFVKQGMLTPLAGGLLDFIIQGGRTLLIAGTRSSGKTSLLSSLMIQLMRSIRIITVEDTLELPVHELKKLNYDIQSLKVKSVITGGQQEISAADGIRTSLRMGDSSLIVGEVRSQEAVALYEAMRVGALANVVAGTIHGDSPYGVFDRVVNDLKVPKTSFKATDIIIVCNPVKSASGLKQKRRVIQITEVRKNWENDPLTEKGFVDLMVYNPKTDLLEPSDALIQGESYVLKSIGARVPEWAGDFDAIWESIQLRAKVIQTILDIAEKEKKPQILEADFMVQSNDEFHKIIDNVMIEDMTNTKLVYNEWLSWFKNKILSIESEE